MLLGSIIPLLLLLLAVCGDKSYLEPTGFIMRKHSIQKPYETDIASQSWVQSGSTIVANECIRLTSDRQSQRGALWNTKANALEHWEALIHFKVTGTGVGHLFGDGFAFWYAKDPSVSGSLFGSKEDFDGLGVFFDTYDNRPGHNNRAYPYIHGYVNSGEPYDPDSINHEINGCQAFFRQADHETYAKIIYRMNSLIVMIDARGQDHWDVCFSVSNIHLPRGYYFGVTASTGHLADNHDIQSIIVSEGEPLSIEERQAYDRYRVQNEANGKPDLVTADLHTENADVKAGEGSAFGWLFYLVLLVIIGGIVAVALKAKSSSGEQYGKRYV